MFILMNKWMIGKNSVKHLLPEKKDFYSYSNMEDITYADYAHPKRLCKDFEIKQLEEFHDLYIQSNTLLLAAVFDPAKFLSALALAWQVALKRLK